MDHHKKVQTSEAFINSAFLAVSGGFQDAYTYFTRDGVFSNAQTGNVVLMSERFMNGEVKAGLHYLVPLTAFFLGVLLAERIQNKFRYARRFHWRQGILLVEIILLFLGRLCTGKYECTGYHHGILLLCLAGTDLPKGRRKLLCQYHVHRESPKRYSSFFSLHTRKKAAPASPGTVLLCHYLSVCYRSRNRRTTLCGIR